MLHLHALGWGCKRIAREFGCSKNTVRRYVEADGWMAYSRRAGGGKLEDQEEWLKERFFRHRGNAEVVRQDLLREQSIDVSLRTVERAVAPWRRLLTAEAKATVRFETPPGRQLQIDFGQLRVPIADECVRVFLFVATLGYSRRCYVAAFRHERQSAWFRGLEGTFRHFGGVTSEVLIDNPRPLVLEHDAKTHAVEFNGRFLAFAAYWGFRPRACAPYRARDEGEGRARCRLRQAERDCRTSLRELDGDGGASGVVAAQDRGQAAPRHHRGSTLIRFEREAALLRPCAGRPPFGQLRDLIRTVHADCAVVVDRSASRPSACNAVYAGTSTSPGSSARGRFLRSRGRSTRNCRSFNATRPACAVPVQLPVGVAPSLLFRPRHGLGTHLQHRLDGRSAHHVDQLVDGPLTLLQQLDHREQQLPVLRQPTGQLPAVRRRLGTAGHDLVRCLLHRWLLPPSFSTRLNTTSQPGGSRHRLSTTPGAPSSADWAGSRAGRRARQSSPRKSAAPSRGRPLARGGVTARERKHRHQRPLTTGTPSNTRLIAVTPASNELTTYGGADHDGPVCTFSRWRSSRVTSTDHQ